MKRGIYQVMVYVFLIWIVVTFLCFIYEMAVADMNVYAIVCLILSILGMVFFVLNQILYRQFKIRDASRYETVICPHCHTENKKTELFCRNCGKELK